jgi:hypothetical protein
MTFPITFPDQSAFYIFGLDKGCCVTCFLELGSLSVGFPSFADLQSEFDT